MSECMIWGRDGAWLQTRGEDGRLRSSYVGRVDFNGLCEFCYDIGLPFYTVGRATAARVVIPSCADAQARPAG